MASDLVPGPVFFERLAIELDRQAECLARLEQLGVVMPAFALDPSRVETLQRLDAVTQTSSALAFLCHALARHPVSAVISIPRGPIMNLSLSAVRDRLCGLDDLESNAAGDSVGHTDFF